MSDAYDRDDPKSAGWVDRLEDRAEQAKEESVSYIVIADKATDPEAWYAGHDEGVSATEVATLIRGGAGSWAALRAQKAGARSNFTSVAMQHGTDREPVIAEFAQMTFGLIPCSALVAQSENLLYRASPDAISADGSEIGEYKTTKRDWETLDDVPPRYIDQMFWQMFVTGARKARLVFEPHEGFVPLYPFPKHFELGYDEARVEELREVADRFMAGGDIDPSALELDALVTARVEAKADADDAAAVVADLDRRIRELAAATGHTKFEGSAGNLTLSADTTRVAFSSTEFKKADPITYEKFMVESPVKGRMTITARSN